MDFILFMMCVFNLVEMKEILNIVCILSVGLNVKIIIRKGIVV